MGWKTKEAAQAWRDANRERCKAYQRKYRETRPELSRAREKRYIAGLTEEARLARLERCREYQRSNAGKWRAKKLERERLRRLSPETKARKAAWHRANKPWLKRDALKRGAKTDDRIDYKAILIRANGKCGICGKPLDLFGTDFDHIVPLSKGGPHVDSNLQATHMSCNRRKGNRIAA